MLFAIFHPKTSRDYKERRSFEGAGSAPMVKRYQYPRCFTSRLGRRLSDLSLEVHAQWWVEGDC